MKGFTLIEILVTLTIFVILLASSVVALSVLRGGSDLQEEARGLQRVFELARSKTIASQGDTRYGVYIDKATSPHQYVLFQGQSPAFDYATRLTSEDKVYTLAETIEFGTVSYGGGIEVVFDRIQGSTSDVGSAELRVKADPSNAQSVSMESLGVVEIGSGAIPNDNDRAKDSRHVHIDYTRIIDTAAEDIVLDFDSGAHIETIVIADHLSGGQIVWEGTVTVGADDQKLKIHTHQLNNGFDSQFSVHRDRRFNTKSLTITVPGTVSDPDSGTLIQYNASGTVTPGSSVNVTSASTTLQ